MKPGSGFSGYLLYLDRKAAGAIEAKAPQCRHGRRPQPAKYAAGLPDNLPARRHLPRIESGRYRALPGESVRDSNATIPIVYTRKSIPAIATGMDTISPILNSILAAFNNRNRYARREKCGCCCGC
jgi:hypothetical protein